MVEVQGTHPLASATVYIFGLFINAEYRVSDGAQIIVSDRGQFRKDARVDLIPGGIRFSRQIDVPKLNKSDRPFHFNLGSAMFVIGPFLGFGAYLVQLSDEGSRHRPRARKVNGLGPQEVSTIRRGVRAKRSVEFQVYFRVANGDSGNEVGFIGGLVVGFLLHVEAMVLPYVYGVLMSGESMVVHRAIRHFRFRGFHGARWDEVYVANYVL